MLFISQYDEIAMNFDILNNNCYIQTSSNLLGGFGRRVSSLLWGSMGGVQGEARLIKVVGTVGRDTDTR